MHAAAWWCCSLQPICFLRIVHILFWHCNLYGFCIFSASGCDMLTCDVCSLCSGLQFITQPSLPVLETHQRSQQTMTEKPMVDNHYYYRRSTMRWHWVPGTGRKSRANLNFCLQVDSYIEREFEARAICVGHTDSLLQSANEALGCLRQYCSK